MTSRSPSIAPRRKALAAASAICAVFAIAACGSANERVTAGTYAGEGGVPAPYINVGPLAYQVQISRALNPADSEDASYLVGLTPSESKLNPGEEWFAVFLQVYNSTGHAHPAATNITIHDEQGIVYKPFTPSSANLFAYRAGNVPPHSRLPEPGSPADVAPTQGALLLFKIKLASLSNRPIEVKIVDPDNPADVGTAELDV